MPTFKARRESAPKFRDLAEDYGEMALSTKPAKKKWYPSLSIKQRVPGLEKVGAVKVVRAKVRMASVEARVGEAPRISLEVQGIADA